MRKDSVKRKLRGYSMFVQKKMSERDDGAVMTFVMVEGLPVIILYVRRHISIFKSS